MHYVILCSMDGCLHFPSRFLLKRVYDMCSAVLCMLAFFLRCSDRREIPERFWVLWNRMACWLFCCFCLVLWDKEKSPDNFARMVFVEWRICFWKFVILLSGRPAKKEKKEKNMDITVAVDKHRRRAKPPSSTGEDGQDETDGRVRGFAAPRRPTMTLNDTSTYCCCFWLGTSFTRGC